MGNLQDDNKHSITPGIYRHIKGKEYVAFNTATDAESLLEFVIYGPIDGSCDFNRRFIGNFTQMDKTKAGKFVEKFSKTHEPYSESTFRSQTIDCKELERKIANPSVECPADSENRTGEMDIIGVSRDADNHALAHDIYSILGEPGLYLQLHSQDMPE